MAVPVYHTSRQQGDPDLPQPDQHALLKKEDDVSLGDIRVVEIGSIPAAAYCGRLMADFGAEVIKIEPPGGDRMRGEPPWFDAGGERHSGFFAYFNYGKKSVTLDYAGKEGAARIHELLTGADVLINGLEHGEHAHLAHLDLDRRELRKRYPQLIIADVEWFGETGPYAAFRGSDAVCRAVGGLVKLIGPAEGPPLAVPDYQSAVVGGLAAYIPVMAALVSRFSGDEGREFEVSLFEANINSTELQVSYATPDSQAEPRLGINSFNSSGGLGIFPCKEGYIGITANTAVQWRDLCALVGRPHYGTDPEFMFGSDRGAKRQKLQVEFAGIFKQRTAKEWFEDGLKLKLPFGLVPSMEELLKLEVFRDRDTIVPIKVANRTVEAPGTPFHLVKTPPAHGGSVPSTGQHSEEVLGKSRSSVIKPGKRASDSQRPLHGVRIIDLSMGWAGPLAGRHLADLGADVIKVEACQYPDWWRGLDKAPNAIQDLLYEKTVRFNLLQRGKRGITLDLTRPQGVELLKGLVKTADALLENNSSGVLRKLGLEYDRLIEVNPSIVMMSMSAYGSTGAWSDLRAYGSTLEQASGLPTLAGYDGGLPVQTHPALGDPVGGLNGCSALLTALLHCKRTGQGQFVDLSLVECMLPQVAVAAVEQSANGKVAPRRGNRHPLHVPHGVFRCQGEDAWVMIAATDDAMWQSLCNAIGRHDLAREAQFAHAEGRRQREDEIDRALEQWTNGRTPKEAMMALQQAGVSAGAVQSSPDLLKDPHLHARGFWQFIDREYLGRHYQASAPFREGGKPYPILRAAPTLGQYNEEVLKGVLGLTDADLKKLTDDNIIGTKPILPEKRKVKVA